ncbi:ParB/RepB/Spo0J family partition protein [Novipirellula aureliae]|nr:ParB N-terminal domain-containing protein [Novipirellula aureliae]
MPNSQPIPPEITVIGDGIQDPMLALEILDERLQRYRLVQPKLERQMMQSLKDYGQVSPIIVFQLEGQMVLVDGFKRLRAARSLKGFTHLQARLLEVDEQAAKAALFNLNRIVGRPVELEEAWVIFALVREDGLQQAEVAQMLGRHKSWVNRRLALIERLCDEARESLRLGLLTPTQARHLIRLPRGNQKAAMLAATDAALTSRELSDVVDLLSASSTAEQAHLVLSNPREALRQSQADYVYQWDPRMSASGNRAAKRLALLLDCLAKMNSWLRYKGRSELQAIDREPLTDGFVKLEQETKVVAEATEDFLKEMKQP